MTFEEQVLALLREMHALLVAIHTEVVSDRRMK